jgi:glycosyltransferase involved in cell wall biosynthesis
MIDADNLRPNQDAGSAMACHYLKIFKMLGYKVTFIPDNLVFEGDYTLDLQRIGVECVYSPYCTSIKDYLTENARYYDYIILTRPYVGIKYLDLLKQCAPQARIIYSSVDLHYLRERRHAELENNPLLAARAERTRRDELRLILESDAAMVVNQVEKDYLAREVPDANVHVVQIVFEEQPPGPAFEARQDILYIGGYLHPPNVDAVLYFTSEILPGIRQRLPGVRFFVLGSNPPLELKALQCEYIVVPGFQADIAPYFNACRLMVAPLRYGAGIKGKLGTSFSYGLPVVATAVAAEGMGLHDRRELLIADTPEDFVQSVIELYTDCGLWERLSVAGRQALRDRFSQQAICRDLERVLESAAKRHIALAAG